MEKLIQSSGSRWCSRSAPWWSSETSTWEVEGAWGHWCQQAGESIYQIEAPRGKGVPASPFTLCLAPAPLWAVAPFVHVRDTEVKVLSKEAVNRASMVVQRSFVSQIMLKALVSFHSHAGRKFSVRNFILSLLKMNFWWRSLPISLQYASWAHRKSTRKIAILVHAKHFISNTWSLGGFYCGLFVCSFVSLFLFLVLFYFFPWGMCKLFGCCLEKSFQDAFLLVFSFVCFPPGSCSNVCLSVRVPR